jgi:hypothetical protein
MTTGAVATIAVLVLAVPLEGFGDESVKGFPAAWKLSPIVQTDGGTADAADVPRDVECRLPADRTSGNRRAEEPIVVAFAGCEWLPRDAEPPPGGDCDDIFAVLVHNFHAARERKARRVPDISPPRGSLVPSMIGSRCEPTAKGYYCRGWANGWAHVESLTRNARFSLERLYRTFGNQWDPLKEDKDLKPDHEFLSISGFAKQFGVWPSLAWICSPPQDEDPPAAFGQLLRRKPFFCTLLIGDP